MSSLCGLIRAVLPQTASQLARDQAYLAQSADLHELERRLREIDARGRLHPRALALITGWR